MSYSQGLTETSNISVVSEVQLARWGKSEGVGLYV